MANGENIDPQSPIGQVRLTIGDDIADGEGNYTFSDDAILVALSLSDGGITRAVGTLVKNLALQAALSGQSIRADDFGINTTGRGKTLLEVAESYFKQADSEDALASAGELAIVGTTLRPHTPELILPARARSPFGFPM